MCQIRWWWMIVVLVLAGCVSGPDGRARSGREETTGGRGAGEGIIPHQHPERWPLDVSSARIVVHYQVAEERAMAEAVLASIEDAWRVQIDEGGARPPLDDHGVAGPDGRFDVYLSPGIAEPYVVDVAPDEATWYDDRSTAMVLDPWGDYGGDALASNIFHELRHAVQAGDDWWEHAHVFEADATAWEVARHGFEREPLAWQDYQAHPEWTLFRDDGYRTWYMYGGALFLLYLRDQVFGGDLSFTNEMWRRCRSAPGAESNPALNEPDFVDALQAMLAARGRSLFGEVTGFARARWYTGARANGSLPGGPVMPEVAHGRHARKAGARRTRLSVSPQVLGTSYVVVERAVTDPTVLWVSLSATAQARFVVQAVGGGAADEALALDAGPARLRFGAGRTVTLVVTALPATGVLDPDRVGTTPMSASLTLSTTP